MSVSVLRVRGSDLCRERVLLMRMKLRKENAERRHIYSLKLRFYPLPEITDLQRRFPLQSPIFRSFTSSVVRCSPSLAFKIEHSDHAASLLLLFRPSVPVTSLRSLLDPGTSGNFLASCDDGEHNDARNGTEHDGEDDPGIHSYILFLLLLIRLFWLVVSDV